MSLAPTVAPFTAFTAIEASALARLALVAVHVGELLLNLPIDLGCLRTNARDARRLRSLRSNEIIHASHSTTSRRGLTAATERYTMLTMATQQVNFRLPAETLAEIDRLMREMALPTRTAVVMLAVRRMARAELSKPTSKKGK